VSVAPSPVRLGSCAVALAVASSAMARGVLCDATELEGAMRQCKGEVAGASTRSDCAIATCLFQRAAAWSLLDEGGDGGLRWVGWSRV